ncbi:MAG: nucleotidyltransferase domain-containing protein [Spirochaetota bacterium]
MDKDETIELINIYINRIKEFIDIKNVYLFGSFANETQRTDSDIDIGIFADSIDEDYFDTLKKLYEIRRSVDVRIEPHLFISGHDRSGFSTEVEKTGIKIQ